MNQKLLNLLQLASPAMPLGAYSYSEGLETLVELQIVKDRQTLEKWLSNELRYGAIKIDTILMLKAHQSTFNKDLSGLCYWNNWLSAARETKELRQQNWQMGNTLLRLLQELENDCAQFKHSKDRFQNKIDLNLLAIETILSALNKCCNYAIAFGIAAAYWDIDAEDALLGYLHSWATNAIGAGVKLIPLGQTTGQQILKSIYSQIASVAPEILSLDNEGLSSCTWGLSLASCLHESQYTRLFRS
jgi:urease accessory protein